MLGALSRFFILPGGWKGLPFTGEIAPAAQPHSRVKALAGQTTDSCSKR